MTTTKTSARRRTLLAVLGLATAAGVLAGPATAAQALPPQPDGGPGAATCTWGNKNYSEGGVVTSDGRKYECRSDGRWHDVGPAAKKVSVKKPPITPPRK